MPHSCTWRLLWSASIRVKWWIHVPSLWKPWCWTWMLLVSSKRFCTYVANTLILIIFCKTLLTHCFNFLPSGGALKPSTIQGLWVHVFCAWFIPEMSFQSVSKMEPADGLSDINFTRFHQVAIWDSFLQTFMNTSLFFIFNLLETHYVIGDSSRKEPCAVEPNWRKRKYLAWSRLTIPFFCYLISISWCQPFWEL